MKSASLVAFSLCLIGAVAGAQAGTGRCVLEVRGKTYLDGPCEIKIDPIDKASFTIGVGEKRRSRYFAYVNMDSDGAHGFWNETPDSSHAQTELGILTRNGACWQNKIARVCAYR